MIFNSAQTSSVRILHPSLPLIPNASLIGHFYFTKLLLPALRAGTLTSPSNHTRIITTSSYGAYMSTIDFDTLKDGEKRRRSGTRKMYSQSKFGNVVVSNEFARRYGGEGVVSMAVNPGECDDGGV